MPRMRPEEQRTGRCRPCNRIYRWPANEGLLRNAHCPYCRRYLDRTCWSICGEKTRRQLSNAVPTFHDGPLPLRTIFKPKVVS